MFPGLQEQLNNMWWQLPVTPVVTVVSPKDWLQGVPETCPEE